MPAILRPIGPLKSYLPGQVEVEVAAGQSIRAALESLGIPPQLVALALVNGAQQPKDYLLQEGDEVKVLAVIGGG